MMYLLVSSASFIIRFWICYKTIEQFPLFENEGIQWIIGEIISIYTILKIICYGIVGRISWRMGIITPTWKSLLYFVLYLPLVAFFWLVLWMFTKIQILPIYIN